jgi:hypothetical protein
MNCVKCKRKVGGLSNYGSNEKPFCYDCVNLIPCDNCGLILTIDAQITLNGKKLCRTCYERILLDESKLVQQEQAKEIQKQSKKGRTHAKIYSTIILIFVCVFGALWIPIAFVGSALKATGMGWKGAFYGQEDFNLYIVVTIVPYLIILIFSIIFFIKNIKNK